MIFMLLNVLQYTQQQQQCQQCESVHTLSRNPMLVMNDGDIKDIILHFAASLLSYDGYFVCGFTVNV